jgi:anti-anti-sigma regulatory factor
MLKITQLSQKGCLTLKLEGRLLESWVGAVRDACRTLESRSGHLGLDLAAVNYVDAAGVHLLRDLMCEGIEIVACSSFIGQLLHLEDSGESGASGAPESSPAPSAHSDRP